MATAGGHNSSSRVRSPGRARCQLNFPRSEQVVQVDPKILEMAKAARREVEQQYGADTMGVRGPQWTCCTALPDSKYTHTASDARLANHLLASTFCPTDLRHTKSLMERQRYDTQHYHAFTRGEATTGWNHSTELASMNQRSAQLQQANSQALAATAVHKQHITRYQSPSQREEAFAEALHQQKQQAAAQAAALIQQYGPDGAAAMQQILAMKRPNRKYICIKASREDVAAVQQLPAAGLPEA